MPSGAIPPDDDAKRWATERFAQPIGEHIFDLGDDLGMGDAPPARRLARITWLLENAGLFADRSPANVGQVVWCLASTAGELRVLFDGTLPREARERGVAAIACLFEGLLARVCEPLLSHTSPEDAGARGWANMACYMFWDIAPLAPNAREPGFTWWEAACLGAMERTLLVPHVACQEAALHGLGHWQYAQPARVAAAVDAFLARTRRFPPELVQYAKQARNGHVL
jgi:hypothetical protein